MVKPTYYFQARVDWETEERRQRLMKLLQCSAPKLLERALRELEAGLMEESQADRAQRWLKKRNAEQALRELEAEENATSPKGDQAD